MLAALAVCAVLQACGGSPSQPSPPPAPAPTLTCPATIPVTAKQGQPVTVAFDVPVAQGGSPPVAVACTPASGSQFPLGTHTVTCTATDALARTASCSFSVVVTPAPQLSSVKFLAYGDSITYGITSDPVSGTLMLAVEDSYPTKLQALLSARYTDQAVTVVNRGVPGEPAIGAGEGRLAGELETHKPDVLLLLHGANDLLDAGNRGLLDERIPKIVDALEHMVETGKSYRVQVMLATFPPQNSECPPGTPRCRGAGAPGLPTLNADIARVAAAEGAVLVDLFNGLGGTPVGSIGIDGLHPTVAGFEKIAGVWFDAIRQTYERPSTTGSSAPVLFLRTRIDDPGQ